MRFGVVGFRQLGLLALPEVGTHPPAMGKLRTGLAAPRIVGPLLQILPRKARTPPHNNVPIQRVKR